MVTQHTQSPLSGIDSAIVVAHCSYRYPARDSSSEPDSRFALDDVSFTVATGESLAITGPIGSGRSTLCLALTGFVPQRTGGTIRGSVTILGLNPWRVPIHDLATTTGIVFQHPEANLIGLTVEDEVAFGLENLGVPADEIADRVHDVLIKTRLDGLTGRSPWHLSGGERQRLAIAAVLVMRPHVLILDEPTTALDPLGRRELIDTLERIHADGLTTMIIATRDSDIITNLVQRVLVLDVGHMRALGPIDSVLATATDWRAAGMSSPVRGSKAKVATDDGVDAPEPGHRMAELGDAGNGASMTGTARTAPSTIISVEHLTVRFPVIDEPVLRDVSLDITSGERIALIGANGAGKSTLARYIAGLRRPEQGRVTIAGSDTRSQPTGRFANTVGFLFQNPDSLLVATRVADDLAIGPERAGLNDMVIKERVAAAADQLGITRQLHKQLSSLDSGVRRLVAFAGILALRPFLLVLDEPMAHLDVASAETVRQALAMHVRGNGAYLLISHNLDTVATLTTRTIVLHDGVIVADGPTPQVLGNQAILRQAELLGPTTKAPHRSISDSVSRTPVA